MNFFSRTKNGFKNQIHFYAEKDWIVYLEGGPSYTFKEVTEENKHSTDTEDIVFWTNIFGSIKPDKKIKFKSIGSKSNLLKLFEVHLKENETSSIKIAMDSEFDELLGQKIKHPNVFYTYGYSWENDIWNADVIKEVIQHSIGLPIKNNEIEKYFDLFLNEVKLAVTVDFYLAGNDEKSLFERNNRNFQFLERPPRELPLFKKDIVEEFINKKKLNKETIFSVTLKHKICPHRYCYGHFLASYSCCFIRRYLTKHHPSLNNIPNNILVRNGLNSYFKNYFRIGSEMYKYYSHQFQRKVIQ